MRSSVAEPHTIPEPQAGDSWSGTWANRITTLRLVSIVPLWALALAGRPVAVGVLLALAASTDVLDGYIARRRGEESAFGTRYDSIVDHLLAASTVAWLLLLRPEFVRDERAVLIPWLVLGGISLVVGWIRFGRIGGFHRYSAKAANAVGFGFVVYLLIFETYPAWLFYVAIGVCYLGSAETLLVQLTRDPASTRGKELTMEPPKPLFRQLAREECTAILARNHVGRLVYARGNQVGITPIHYVYADDWIYGRTSPGEKMEMIGPHWWPVAFEVDEVEALFRWRSVIVHGGFYPLQPHGAAPEVEAWHRAVERLRTLIPETLREDDPVPERTLLFRIAVQEITGREAQAGG